MKLWILISRSQLDLVICIDKKLNIHVRKENLMLQITFLQLEADNSKLFVQMEWRKGSGIVREKGIRTRYRYNVTSMFLKEIGYNLTFDTWCGQLKECFTTRWIGLDWNQTGCIELSLIKYESNELN